MRLLYLLPAALHAICALAAPAPAPEAEPAPYIVTEYVVLSVYTQGGYTYTGKSYTSIDEPSLYTYTRNVVPTATTYTAISEETSTSYDHVTIIEVVLPTGVAALASTTYDPYAIDTRYVVPITYTPSASCSQTWSYVSNVPIHIPTLVEAQITPIATMTSLSTYNGYYTPTTYTSVYAILAQSQIDPDVYTSASLFYAPSRLSYCATPSQNCYTSTAADAALTATCSVYWSYSSSGNNNYYSDYNYDDGWYRTTLIVAITVPVGWIFVWLIAGLVESFYSFKGLMLGKKRKRGLPYSWCCISWLFLCWTGPTYAAKSEEERAELKTKWDAYTAGEKFKLWMKWGFRWKYPDVLGEEPEKAKRPFRQGCL